MSKVTSPIRFGQKFSPLSEAYGLNAEQLRWAQLRDRVRPIQDRKSFERPPHGAVVALRPTSQRERIEPGDQLLPGDFEIVTLGGFFPGWELEKVPRHRFIFPVAIQRINREGEAGPPQFWGRYDLQPLQDHQRTNEILAEAGDLDLVVPREGAAVELYEVGPYWEVWSDSVLCYRLPVQPNVEQVAGIGGYAGVVSFPEPMVYSRGVLRGDGRPAMSAIGAPTINGGHVSKLRLLNDMFEHLLEHPLQEDPPALLDVVQRLSSEEFSQLLQTEPQGHLWQTATQHLAAAARGTYGMQIYAPPGVEVYETDRLEAQPHEGGPFRVVTLVNDMIQGERDIVVPAQLELFESPGPQGTIGRLPPGRILSAANQEDSRSLLLQSLIQHNSCQDGDDYLVPVEWVGEMLCPSQCIYTVSGSVEQSGDGLSVIYGPVRQGELEALAVPKIQSWPPASALKRNCEPTSTVARK